MIEEIEREEQITSHNRVNRDTGSKLPYWNQAVSKVEMIRYHIKKFGEHEFRKNASRISETFYNSKSARAICEKGNKLHIFSGSISVVSTS